MRRGAGLSNIQGAHAIDVQATVKKPIMMAFRNRTVVLQGQLK